MVDADTVFEPGHAAPRSSQPFADGDVGAVAGNTKVGNRARPARALAAHRVRDGLQPRPPAVRRPPVHADRARRDRRVPAPRRSTASAAFSGATLAEDTDLTMAIGRAGWRVVYAEDARAWTEAPATLSRALAPALPLVATARCRRSGSTGRRSGGASAGRIGRRGLPYLVLFQIALPLLAPLIDLFALYGVVFLDPVPMLAYWVAFNVAPARCSALYAFRLDGERCGRCGRCRSSSSSTASSCISSSSESIDQRGPRRRGCAGSTSSAPARSRSPVAPRSQIGPHGPSGRDASIGGGRVPRARRPTSPSFRAS